MPTPIKVSTRQEKFFASIQIVVLNLIRHYQGKRPSIIKFSGQAFGFDPNLVTHNTSREMCAATRWVCSRPADPITLRNRGWLVKFSDRKIYQAN